MFPYSCPFCSQRLLALPDRVGQRTICPKCLRPLTIPRPESDGDEVGHDPTIDMDTIPPSRGLSNGRAPATAPDAPAELTLSVAPPDDDLPPDDLAGDDLPDADLPPDHPAHDTATGLDGFLAADLGVSSSGHAAPAPPDDEVDLGLSGPTPEPIAPLLAAVAAPVAPPPPPPPPPRATSPPTVKMPRPQPLGP